MDRDERRKRIRELEMLIADSESELSLLLAEEDEEVDSEEDSS